MGYQSTIDLRPTISTNNQYPDFPVPRIRDFNCNAAAADDDLFDTKSAITPNHYSEVARQGKASIIDLGAQCVLYCNQSNQ